MTRTEIAEPAPQSYKARMRSAARNRPRRPIWTAALGVLLLGASSCGDDDTEAQNPLTGAGGASDAGEAGMPGDLGGSETGGVGASAGLGGESGGEGGFAGGAAGAGNAGAASAGSPGALPCFQDSDCDDRLYCNGVERCLEKFPTSDVRVCMVPEQGPCGPAECDEAQNACDCTHADNDGDGFLVEGCARGKPADCDDEDATRRPGQTEVCDADDPEHDEDCSDKTYGTKDSDGDGYFDAACANARFLQPLVAQEAPLLNRGSDCDDTLKTVHPQAEEQCDGIDNNCNGVPDEVYGAPLGEVDEYFRDLDSDYFGDPNESLLSLCSIPPPGYAHQAGDCDDLNPKVTPGRGEACNGLDDDCDGTVDQPLTPGTLMFDEPYDGETEFECTGEAGWKVTQCPPGRLNCGSEDYRDACETIGTTLCNCHACGNVCEFSCGETSCEEVGYVATGSLHTCAILQPPLATPGAPLRGSAVACFGKNATGQLGNGATKDSPIAVKVLDLTDVTALTAGDAHSCAIAAGKVFCWGSNSYGQLGAGLPTQTTVGEFVFRPYPVPTVLPPLLGSTEPRQLTSGADHTCAIYDGGALLCWGRGDHGQLGTGVAGEGEVNTAPAPVQRLVGGQTQAVGDATQVVAGYRHTCALSSGIVECWGDNSAGQLGEDPEELTGSSRPRLVPGLEGLVIDELSASGAHTCARAGSEVNCWGSNYRGELALADVEWAPPTKIELPEDVVSIVSGLYFACATRAAGPALCWGSNRYGERAADEDPAELAPTEIPLEDMKKLYGGYGYHLCAATSGDRIACWGRNNFGQLGNGETSETPQPRPQPIQPLGGSRACASGD